MAATNPNIHSQEFSNTSQDRERNKIDSWRKRTEAFPTFISSCWRKWWCSTETRHASWHTVRYWHFFCAHEESPKRHSIVVQVHHVQTRPWQGIHEIHVSLRCFVFFLPFRVFLWRLWWYWMCHFHTGCIWRDVIKLRSSYLKSRGSA